MTTEHMGSYTTSPLNIFVHTLFGNSHQWDEWLKYIPLSVAVDLYGHGKRPGNFKHIDLNTWVLDLRDYLAPLKSDINLIGVSAGGLVAQKVASYMPDRVKHVITINSSMPYECGRIPTRLYFIRSWLIMAILKSLAFGGECLPSEESMRRMTGGPSMPYEKESCNALFQVLFARLRVPSLKNKCKVTVIATSDDAVCPVEKQDRLAKYHGLSNAVVLPGSHMAPFLPNSQAQIMNYVSYLLQKPARLEKAA